MNNSEKNNFGTTSDWDFIEMYYPNYYSCNDILLSDIFIRKLENEFVSESDEIFLKLKNIRKELVILNEKIWTKAIENYLKIKEHNDLMK